MKKVLAGLVGSALVLQMFAAAASATEPTGALPHLAIYYGWPSAVNGAGGNVTTATNTFNQFDVIVFADGIEHATHGDHANTATIMTNLKNAGKKVFGYVDLGVSTQNLSTTVMKQYVDEWYAMGAYGIFLDDYGFDYGVTRARQNTMLDYIHGKGMKVFMNSWNVDDASGDKDETGAASTTHAQSGDWYLAESWLVSGNAYQSTTDWYAKANKALAYKRNKGINTAVVSTAASGAAGSSDHTSDKYKMAWWGAAMYNFPFQWTDLNYSASNGTLYYYNNLSTSYGSTYSADPTNPSSGQYQRTTNTGQIVMTGNGSTTGTGSFTTSGSGGGGGGSAITVDGNTADWSSVSTLASTATTAQTLKVTNDSTNLYILVQGSGLNVKSQFYINKDNNNATGFNVGSWTTSGTDVLVENNSVYTYSGSSNSWAWTGPVLTLSASQLVNTSTVIEVAIPLQTLGVSAGQSIKLGYIQNDSTTARLPGANASLPTYTLQ
ncbi:hypothetical protein HQN90_35300 [Paenibacillus alba]|uniref:hypothetical protein n=1 Tax=Paenibacillus alba TaxID=1197127 RepID=UPI0015679B31|nr:hypothetical protein [Paenibacillus alba]NQX71364.1 hypothetical protein [Paenibacillus alba]